MPIPDSGSGGRRGAAPGDAVGAGYRIGWRGGVRGWGRFRSRNLGVAMKRPKVTSQRVMAAALVLIALSLAWQTVRQELGWWGTAGWFGYAPLGAASASEFNVEVTDLWTVNGEGAAPVGIDLAAGVWTIELIQPSDDAGQTGVGLNWGQGAIGWTSDNPVIVHVGPGHEDADLGLPEGPVNLSVDTDGSWTVLLEPVACP